MKKPALALFSLMSILNLTHAQAQADRGNGGGVIACYDRPYTVAGAKMIHAEVLDYFEASEQTSLKLDLGSASLTVEQKVLKAISRIEANEPDRAKLLKEKYEEFKTRSKVLSRSSIKTISDTRELISPTGNCYRLQGAVQIKNPEAFEFKYMIDRDVWAAMEQDSNQQAGLILHEILYSLAIEQGATNSDEVRKFNALVSSSDLDRWSWVDYLKYVKAHLGSVYYQGQSLRSVSFNDRIIELSGDHFLVQVANTHSPVRCDGTVMVDIQTRTIVRCDDFKPRGTLSFGPGAEMNLDTARLTRATFTSDGFLKHLDLELGDRNSFVNPRGEITLPILQENRSIFVKGPTSAFDLGDRNYYSIVSVDFDQAGNTLRIDHVIHRVGSYGDRTSEYLLYKK